MSHRFVGLGKDGEKVYLYDEQRKKVKPDLEGVGKKIEKNISEKAFMAQKRKESDEQRKKVKPDLEGIGKKIEKDVEEIEKKKRG